MSGIACDGGNFWVMTYYPDPGTVYKMTPTGTILQQFTPPNNQPWDICKQGDNLWIADYNANMISKVTQTGTLLENQASEIQKPAGIAWDGQYLWYVAGALSAPSTLYKVDLSGTGTPVIGVSFTQHDFGNVVCDPEMLVIIAHAIAVVNGGIIEKQNFLAADWIETEYPATFCPIDAIIKIGAIGCQT